MYQAKSGVKIFSLYWGGGVGGPSTKNFFASLNMYQAKSGVWLKCTPWRGVHNMVCMHMTWCARTQQRGVHAHDGMVCTHTTVWCACTQQCGVHAHDGVVCTHTMWCARTWQHGVHTHVGVVCTHTTAWCARKWKKTALHEANWLPCCMWCRYKKKDLFNMGQKVRHNGLATHFVRQICRVKNSLNFLQSPPYALHLQWKIVSTSVHTDFDEVPVHNIVSHRIWRKD